MTGKSLRPRSARPTAIILAAVAVFGAILLGRSGVAFFDILFGIGAMALIGFLGYWLFWLPEVLIDDFGLTLVNPVRTVQIPWRELGDVSTRYSLTVQAAGRKFGAWAAPASGMVREGTARGNYAQIAATLIAERREGPGATVAASKRSAAADPNQALDQQAVDNQTHWIAICILLVLLVITVGSALISGLSRG